MKIAIIGAGAAGLAALKHALEDGHEKVVAFEQTGTIGGTWNYVESTHLDENGLPVHSSMYQGLVTNLPKELMEFEDFKYEEKGKSFIPQADVFYKTILQIEPLPQDKWDITVKDVKTKEIEIQSFDAVIICTGNYFNPKYPEMKGIDDFKGRTTHSHYYRKADPYNDRIVLIIGAGPSGTDISRLISKVAKKVYVSYGETLYTPLEKCVIAKPKVAQLFEKSAKFEDGTEEEIDDIIFCTGYKYTYSFLNNKSGITVSNNFVSKLYKHVINIEHPTMAFIGVVFTVCPFPAFCIQARFFLSHLKGSFEVSKEEMLQDFWKDRAKRDQLGYPEKWAHKLGAEQGIYFDDLADTANIKRLPPVIHKLYSNYKRNPVYRYKVISENDYILYEN